VIGDPVAGPLLLLLLAPLAGAAVVAAAGAEVAALLPPLEEQADNVSVVAVASAKPTHSARLVTAIADPLEFKGR
jgi:hypothetical protein